MLKLLLPGRMKKVVDKMQQKPKKYESVEISTKVAKVKSGFYQADENIINASIIYEKDNKQIEWSVVDGEIVKCPYAFVGIFSRKTGDINAFFGDDEEIKVEDGKEKESTLFISSENGSELLLGIVQSSLGTFAFFYDNIKQEKHCMMLADTSDFYGIWKGMRLMLTDRNTNIYEEGMENGYKI